MSTKLHPIFTKLSLSLPNFAHLQNFHSDLTRVPSDVSPENELAAVLRQHNPQVIIIIIVIIIMINMLLPAPIIVLYI
jgi:hypothetical protein